MVRRPEDAAGLRRTAAAPVWRRWDRYDAPGLLHVAYRVDDVEAEHRSLVAQGFRSLRGPHALAAAKATTALLEDPSGLQIQLIQYAPDSPDL